VERAAEGVQLLVAEEETNLGWDQSRLAEEPSRGAVTDVVEHGLIAGPGLGEASLQAAGAGSELLRDLVDARPFAVEPATEEGPDLVGDRGRGGAVPELRLEPRRHHRQHLGVVSEERSREQVSLEDQHVDRRAEPHRAAEERLEELGIRARPGELEPERHDVGPRAPPGEREHRGEHPVEEQGRQLLVGHLPAGADPREIPSGLHPEMRTAADPLVPLELLQGLAQVPGMDGGHRRDVQLVGLHVGAEPESQVRSSLCPDATPEGEVLRHGDLCPRPLKPGTKESDLPE